MKSGYGLLLGLFMVVMCLPSLGMSADLANLKVCREKSLAAAALITAEGENAFAKLRDQNGGFRYAGSEGYVWVHDLNGIMLMHPIKPAMEGQNFLEMRDVNGVYIFEAFNSVATQKGKGWVAYAWRKPGERGSSPKVSFVVLARHGGKNYVIGSGLYDYTSDDVRSLFSDDPIYEE